MNEYNVYRRDRDHAGKGVWVYVGFIKADSPRVAVTKIRKLSMRVRTGDRLKAVQV